jgi:nitroreductase
LLSRQSTGLVRNPAPDDDEVAVIINAGLGAPDHGRLRPWQLVLVRMAAACPLAVARSPANALLNPFGRNPAPPAST